MPTPTHKSATSVTLAPLAEKSPIQEFVERLWKPVLAVALVLSGWLVYRESQRTKENARRNAEWSLLTAQAPLEGFPRIPTAEPGTFEGLSRQLAQSPAGPWAKALEANAHASERNYDAALSSLTALKSAHPSHMLVQSPWPYEAGAQATFVDAWVETLQRRQAWESSHPHLFANPPPGEGAPRVKITTERGEIVLELDRERAPLHVAAFLQHVADGQWKDVKFFRIDPQMGVDIGTADGTGQPIPHETTGLHHFEGAVSAGDGSTGQDSSRDVFSLLVEDRHDLDGERVVFGRVASGLDIVRQIATADQKPDAPGQPQEPVSVTAIELLNP